VLITALLAAFACASGPAATVWGNESETFTILPDGARFEGLCLEGVVAETIAIDKSGTISARGTLRRMGGARREDDPQPVVFTGKVSGETMELTIESADRAPILKSTLRKGVRGQSRPCA